MGKGKHSGSIRVGDNVKYTDYAKLVPKKAFGGSSVTKVRGSGTASEWLFYFKPDTVRRM